MVKWMCVYCGDEFRDPVELDEHRRDCEKRPINSEGAHERL